MTPATDPRPRIHLTEVAPRDGLQAEACFVPSADKIALIDMLSRSGLTRIEVTSFVSPKAIPALADADVVLGTIHRAPEVTYTVLVPNLRGAERALPLRPDEFNLVMSVSESHNRANLRRSCEESFIGLREVIALARTAGIAINVSLSTAFGCPYEGEVAQARMLDWVWRFFDLGVDRLTLCDTTGMAYPAQVSAICAAWAGRWPLQALTLHFHNTRGMGLANVLAGAAAGVRRFDASLGGLGGCPYAPGATGNVCTEDVAHMLELEGYDCGIDIDILLDASEKLQRLVGHEIPGQILKAGRRMERRTTAIINR
jgi:hydroxymethylglutaryl-CoA lyase